MGNQCGKVTYYECHYGEIGRTECVHARTGDGGKEFCMYAEDDKEETYCNNLHARNNRTIEDYEL